MGIRDASRKCSSEFDNSNRICTAYEQNEQDYSRQLKEILDAVRKENIEKNRNLQLDLIQNSEKDLKWICTHAAQTGESSWIITYGKVDNLWLNTTEFHNAVANRYSLSTPKCVLVVQSTAWYTLLQITRSHMCSSQHHC
ncbi:hypothetical protein GJ496_011407 [Pomphorhynchus laevis]|nr:hypothetical protein GJ496_011407 [Pomphorhynchus laevis]